LSEDLTPATPLPFPHENPTGKIHRTSGVLAGMSKPIKLLIATILIGASLLPATAAATASTRGCRSADLRYPFMPGQPNAFGVFALQIAHGTCTTAHRVAKAWMARFETAFRGAGPLIVPRSVDGFRFKTLPVQDAQVFRERGESGATTISFLYRIPNG